MVRVVKVIGEVTRARNYVTLPFVICEVSLIHLGLAWLPCLGLDGFVARFVAEDL